MELEKVLNKLRPNTEWVIRGNSLEGLEFIKPKTATKPTQEECDQAWLEILAEREVAATEAATIKANALSKLAALGLTENEVKAVFGI
jgi:hypothetical protein